MTGGWRGTTKVTHRCRSDLSPVDSADAHGAMSPRVRLPATRFGLPATRFGLGGQLGDGRRAGRWHCYALRHCSFGAARHSRVRCGTYVKAVNIMRIPEELARARHADHDAPSHHTQWLSTTPNALRKALTCVKAVTTESIPQAVHTLWGRIPARIGRYAQSIHASIHRTVWGSPGACSNVRITGPDRRAGGGGRD